MSTTPEWQSIGPKTLQRKLRGAEVLINGSEQFQDGNYQLAGYIQFETNISADDMEKHARAAWYQTRLLHPVIGVEVVSKNDPSLDNATFQMITDVEEQEKWAMETCLIVNDGRTVEEVNQSYNNQIMTSTGKKCTLTVVTNPRSGDVGLIVWMSHVVGGHNIKLISETWIEQLVKEESEPSTFVAEKVEELHQRLPRSTVQAYLDTYKPTEEVFGMVRKMSKFAAMRYSKKTIGIPTNDDYLTRPSKIQSLVYYLTEEDTTAIKKALKENKVSSASAYYSCLCSSIHEMYSNGKEEGVHLTYSAHAARWLDTEGQNGSPPISMAVIPANSWVDATEEEFKKNDALGLLDLARKIHVAQRNDLMSPHVIADQEDKAKAFVAGFADPSKQKKVESPLIGRPTLTAHGLTCCVPKVPSGPPAETWLKVTKWDIFGRNTDPVVCFSLQETEDRRFRYYLLFDEKYFQLQDTEKLAEKVRVLFRSIASLTTINKV